MKENFYICIIHSKGFLKDVFIHDNKFFYPLIDPYNFGLKPPQMIIEKASMTFKKILKKNSIKIKKDFFYELKKSIVCNELSIELRLILIKYFPDKEELFI
jgi:hypothetical protein